MDCETTKCFLDFLGDHAAQAGENLGITPFTIYFMLGGIVLFVFSRDRLDRSLAETVASRSGGDKADRTLSHEDFEAFVRSFRPSELCISRAFTRAWLAYGVLLIMIYTVASVFIAIVTGAASLDQPFAGFSGQRQVDSSSVSDGGTPQPGATFATVVEVSDLDPAAASVAPKLPDSDPAQWPLLLALMVVGLVPSVPWVCRVEHGIRNIALEFAGIPGDVVVLWNQLRRTPVLPDDAVDRNALLDALSRDRGNLITRSVAQAQRYANAQDESASDTLAQLFLFHEWTTRKPQWPDDTVRKLYSRGELKAIEQSISEIARDLEHFDAVCTLLSSEAARRIPAMATDDPGVPLEYAGLVESASEGLNLEARWDDLCRRAETSAEQVRAKVALYAERVSELPDEGKLRHLYNWIDEAKRRPGAWDTSSKDRNYAGMVVQGALICWALGAVAPTLADLLNHNADLSGSRLLSDGVTTGLPWLLEALAYLVPAAFVVKTMRDDPSLRLDWPRFGRKGWRSHYARLATLAGALGALAVVVGTWAGQFLYISDNEQFSLRAVEGTMWLPHVLFDWTYWFNALHILAFSVTTASLAIALTLVADLCAGPVSSPKLLGILSGCLVALFAVKFLEFCIPLVPRLREGAVELGAIFGQLEWIETFAFLLVAGLWIRQRAKHRSA